MIKLAQIPLSPPDGFRGLGALGLEGKSATDAGGVFNQFISSIIGIMTIVAFIWFVFLFIGGAYSIMNAGGDKAQLESARKKLITGIVGLVIVIAAIFIIDLIGNIIGIPDILNPGALI